MNTLVNAPAAVAAPRSVHINEEIVMVSMITRNKRTGLITFLSAGANDQSSLDVLNAYPDEPMDKLPTPAATIAVEQTATIPPRRRGRPRKNAETPVAVPAAPAATTAAAPAAAGKGFNKPITKKIFAIANMVGKGIILTKKNKEMEVWIVEEDGDKYRVCNPDKDQSSMKKGFVFGATWKIEQTRLIKML